MFLMLVTGEYSQRTVGVRIDIVDLHDVVIPI